MSVMHSIVSTSILLRHRPIDRRLSAPGDLLARDDSGASAASQTRSNDRAEDSEDDQWHGRCMK
ncbi:hypothetical protein ASF63_05900 [Microbacterium sp. Leaf320]|nr:hypothetical protein ASF63_05900 [Microbacterium sp. Leaf320]